MKMNKHYNELKASYLFVDIAHKVAAYQEAHPEKEIIRLGIGDVTQPLAKCVVDAMHDAVTEMGTKKGFHGYGPEQGYPFLKQAIQGYYAGRGTKLDEDEIFISDGAKSDLANVLGLFDVDNTVLVPDPVYPTYVDDNVTDGRKIIYGRTSQENGFLGMPDDSVKADIIYICSPNNPTGAAYTRDQLKAWVEYARKNNAIILYDAAYECFISDGELARSIFEIDGARECAIEICSFSKIAGFTGTRCGYTVVPKELEREGMNINKLWLRRQTTKFNGVPYVVQRGAAAVFTESGMAEIQHNLDYYRKNAIHAGLKLVDCPIRHLGTEKAQQLYLNIQNYLLARGVEMLFNTECDNILLEGSECKGVVITEKGERRELRADQVVIATGRRGADWLEKLCAEHNIAHKPGTVDIGVRVECRNEIMETINKVLYEGKLIGYPNPWKNKVRTFCQNPGGFVAQENYDNDLAVVNGHSYKDLKSGNTNLAILVSHNFTEPFNQPIAYAQKVGELTNMLGAGHILVQRYGDILDGKRTWAKELAHSNVRPTLKDAVAGDITAAMPYRAMVSIIEFIKMVDHVAPGFAAPETLLYSPELKFYSNKVKMDTDLETNISGLHCLGDSSGWTRGLMMASVMGVLMGRKLIENHDM